MNSDFKELLRIFNENQVKYLIVGGYAVSEHSIPRYTKDLDLWVEPDKDNAKRVFASLKQFGAPLTKVTEATFEEQDVFYRMGIPPVQVDILMSIEGLDFEKAWSNRYSQEIDTIPVSFISKQDLITAKRIAGRSQDLVDAELLQKSLEKPSPDIERNKVKEKDFDRER